MKATAQESSKLFPLCSVVAWRLSVAPGYCGGVQCGAWWWHCNVMCSSGREEGGASKDCYLLNHPNTT